MKFVSVLRFAAAALATVALMVPGVAPANAAAYPPHVSALQVSPVMSDGYVTVVVSGEYLTSALTVRASSGSRAMTSKVKVVHSGNFGVALMKVGSLLPPYAGRYSVFFRLQGSSVSGNVTTKQTYTIGTNVSIKYLKVSKKSYGLYISGKAAKSAPVKISIKFGSKTYTKTVKSSSKTGNFSYKFHKTSKGTYKVTAQVAPNKKYFSSPVTVSYHR